ncbi:MAG TPA: NAD-dependent deacylase [Bacteroidota bacterium]|nr:NAD-dependent deacylase [Bacteroidota bacterium]
MTTDGHDSVRMNALERARAMLRGAGCVVAFTGAGISVESGIPPFRGEDGIWERYDPACLELDFFRAHPARAWEAIRELFYTQFAGVLPNAAHSTLADMERRGHLAAVITQNIDGLHHAAGSRVVHEYHGNARRLRCMLCDAVEDATPGRLAALPPRCACGGVYKPDFVFFGEAIPDEVHRLSLRAVQAADVLLVVGTTGEVYPAAQLPRLARQHGAAIVEINTEASAFTRQVADVFLQGKAGSIVPLLARD